MNKVTYELFNHVGRPTLALNVFVLLSFARVNCGCSN